MSAVARFPQYDYVLEIHFNALQGGAADDRTKGVECYVTTGETGTEVEEAICRKLAALGLTNRGVKRKDWSVIRTARKAGVPAALPRRPGRHGGLYGKVPADCGRNCRGCEGRLRTAEGEGYDIRYVQGIHGAVHE